MGQVNIIVDKMGNARVGDFGLMTMGNIDTSLFSESTDLLGGYDIVDEPGVDECFPRQLQGSCNPRVRLLCAWDGSIRGELDTLAKAPSRQSIHRF